MNAVRSYFRRNWKREDLMNFDEIPVDLHRTFKKKRRVLLLMLSAYSFGASLGIFTEYLFEIEQQFLVGMTTDFTIFLGGAMVTRERREIYQVCLIFCSVLMFSSFAYNSLEGRQLTHWMIKLHAGQSLFLGYLVLYSQEILYYANFGDINFVNCTFTVFFHLPAILIHAARIYISGWRLN
ncbi:Bax inhibitor 1 [Datura stramonium]|uniref:Bax inhibitor 1 n=1 Tax=Datura stramonium TaxID=4076 RepID=A0ABS8V677_DATST|nr:Bax inhibitor 1 [Datura stramonium]